MGRQDDSRKIIWTALSVSISIIILLVSAWAVEISRHVQAIDDRQRDVLIRLRAVEYQLGTNGGER